VGCARRGTALARQGAREPPRSRSALLLSPFVLAELDYLLAARVGSAARTSLLAEVESGAYQLEPLSGADVGEALTLIRRHAGLGVSLADASVVVLARRHAVQDLLTLDERHFRTLAVDGRPFRLLQPMPEWRRFGRCPPGSTDQITVRMRTELYNSAMAAMTVTKRGPRSTSCWSASRSARR